MPALRLKIRLGEGPVDRLLGEREIHRIGLAIDLLDERREPLLFFGGDVLALHEIEHEGDLSAISSGAISCAAICAAVRSSTAAARPRVSSRR